MDLIEQAAIRKRHRESPILNRSLVRGVEILRAFQPGIDLLGNGEIAERTQLSRSTVSRLTQTLVECGLLEYEISKRAYRLAAPVLSMAHSMRTGSPFIKFVTPLMQSLAERKRINVGLAVADRDEMIYLESFRFNKKMSLRNVVAGQRVPMELTSLGRAYLAVLPEHEKESLLVRLKRKHLMDWGKILEGINLAQLSVHAKGYCTATWQPEVVAISSPLSIPDRPIYVLNVSVRTTSSLESIEQDLCGELISLRDQASRFFLTL